ncbi:PREDICTED: arf-GAP with coiled-coil, ANK repeat and PH domain-containing protein 2-like [Amphimedon queenslandica]|uniref:Uncharacterized protein n=2 Tax=Amphimedon queenslandica TaxID=400682 RepID=A0AAN0JN69_AMPQE|nr:PREDICTED: arf-GAP with coiled-coil, ANK repeat and PH domain-containing protein 2-like [Amphimedon queenslandica]|eukprot:XP_019858459.1 PREDICTED: arf-GAP with coiled-coil, ANK repeat and PH domain-containing protein 2-like [Amphimedon queenslandica]
MAIYVPDWQLYNAAKDGDIERMRTALSNGADINWRNPRTLNRTSLHEAAFNNRSDAVQWLLSKGAGIDSRASMSCILNDTHIITT